MDNSGMFGEMLEKGQSAVKKASKQTASDFAQAAKGQITGSQNDQGTNEQANAAAQNQQQPQMTDQDRVEFLRNLYGKSDKSPAPDKSKPQGTQNPIAQAVGMTPKNTNEGKSPEELAKIEALRQQLHGDYYQNLTTPQKQQEESVTEKLEREDQEEQSETLQKEKEKPDPLANVKKGTGESVVGVSG